jgi:hypothetical protein
VDALFYVARNGEVIGKYSEQEFREKIFSSEVGADDYYFVEGMKQWVLVSQYRTSHEPHVLPPLPQRLEGPKPMRLPSEQKIPPRAVYAIIAAVLVLFGMALCKSSNTGSSVSSTGSVSRVGCIDAATAKPALDEAASQLDAAVSAAKGGDTTTAAAHMRSAAASLRTAAGASSADPAVSKPLMVAAQGYDMTATAYASGDESKATLYASTAVAFVQSSTVALRQTKIPRCR